MVAMFTQKSSGVEGETSGLLFGCTLQNLAEANEDLEKKMQEMKEELKNGRIEMERTTDDYLKLKVGDFCTSIWEFLSKFGLSSRTLVS